MMAALHPAYTASPVEPTRAASEEIENDFARAAGLHSRRHGFAAIEHAAKIDRDHFVPNVGVGLDERPHHVPSGVVHQDVDWSQFAFDAIGGCDRFVELGDVKRNRDRGRADPADFRGGLLGGIELDIRQRHLCAFVGEPDRDCPPDSIGCTGYDRDFACEAGHDSNLTGDPAAVDDECRRRVDAMRIAGRSRS